MFNPIFDHDMRTQSQVKLTSTHEQVFICHELIVIELIKFTRSTADERKNAREIGIRFAEGRGGPV